MSSPSFPLSATLSALAIAFAAAEFFAMPAEAQMTPELSCNGCVSSKNLKDGGVRGRDIGESAVGFRKLGSSVQQRIDNAGYSNFLWLPAADAVVRFGDSTQAHAEIENYGRACVAQDVGGSLLVDVFFPIQIDVPRNGPYKVKSARVYYSAPDSTAFINRTKLQGRNFGTGVLVDLATDFTQQNLPGFTGYSIRVTENGAVTNRVAPTEVALQLRMTAIGSKVCLYGVRLRLS